MRPVLCLAIIGGGGEDKRGKKLNTTLTNKEKKITRKNFLRHSSLNEF